MNLEDILQALVKAPTLTKAYLHAAKEVLLAEAARFESMEWNEQSSFERMYGAAVCLMVARLRDGLDPEPCDDMDELVTRAPFEHTHGFDFCDWIASNGLLGPDDVGLDRKESVKRMAERLSTDAVVALASFQTAAFSRRLDKLASNLDIEDGNETEGEDVDDDDDL